MGAECRIFAGGGPQGSMGKSAGCGLELQECLGR